MYIGDSIPHGANSASWRWAMHKIFTDNGITYTSVGYKTGNYNGGGRHLVLLPCGETVNDYGNLVFVQGSKIDLTGLQQARTIWQPSAGP